MESGTLSHMLKWFKAPHPTWQSKKSRNRVGLFLQNEELRSPGGFRLNIGCGDQRLVVKAFNLDLVVGTEVDIQGDLLRLPIKDESGYTCDRRSRIGFCVAVPGDSGNVV